MFQQKSVILSRTKWDVFYIWVGWEILSLIVWLKMGFRPGRNTCASDEQQGAEGAITSLDFQLPKHQFIIIMKVNSIQSSIEINYEYYNTLVTIIAGLRPAFKVINVNLMYRVAHGKLIVFKLEKLVKC